MEIENVQQVPNCDRSISKGESKNLDWVRRVHFRDL